MYTTNYDGNHVVRARSLLSEEMRKNVFFLLLLTDADDLKM